MVQTISKSKWQRTGKNGFVAYMHEAKPWGDNLEHLASPKNFSRAQQSDGQHVKQNK